MDIKKDLFYESVATALMHLATAWNTLTTLTKQDENLDLTDAYPFIYLDFEQLTPAVKTWCSRNAAKLLDGIQLSVTNPACVKYCDKWKQAKFSILENKCSMSESVYCGREPFITFNPENLRNWMVELTNDVTYKQLSDEDLYFAYQQYLNKIAISE